MTPARGHQAFCFLFCSLCVAVLFCTCAVNALLAPAFVLRQASRFLLSIRLTATPLPVHCRCTLLFSSFRHGTIGAHMWGSPWHLGIAVSRTTAFAVPLESGWSKGCHIPGCKRLASSSLAAFADAFVRLFHLEARSRYTCLSLASRSQSLRLPPFGVSLPASTFFCGLDVFCRVVKGVGLLG